MTSFQPNLAVLWPPQLRLWQEIDATPQHFTLYGGTALALRLGHRSSVDFDFFSNQSFDPDELTAAVEAVEIDHLPVLTPFLRRAEQGGGES